MKFLVVFQVFATLVIATDINVNRGYYWRNYNWKIPADAVPGGKDTNGDQTYIGQAYIPGDGVVVVQIFPSAKEIFAASYGLKKATTVIKILCSMDKDKFSWMKTSARYFHVNVTDQNPVIGGFNHRELNKGMLHVGRVTHLVATRLGSIDGFLEIAKINYVHGTTIQSANDFEVLLYNKGD